MFGGSCSCRQRLIPKTPRARANPQHLASARGSTTLPLLRVPDTPQPLEIAWSGVNGASRWS